MFGLKNTHLKKNIRLLRFELERKSYALKTIHGNYLLASTERKSKKEWKMKGSAKSERMFICITPFCYGDRAVESNSGCTIAGVTHSWILQELQRWSRFWFSLILNLEVALLHGSDLPMTRNFYETLPQIISNGHIFVREGLMQEHCTKDNCLFTVYPET